MARFTILLPCQRNRVNRAYIKGARLTTSLIFLSKMLPWFEMIGFIVRIIGNSVALYAAYYFVPGFIVAGGIKEYLLAGILFGLLNKIVKPPIKLLTMPLIILTLGLFLVVINALMLWLVDFVIIESITALVWATIITAFVNAIIGAFSKIID